MGGGGACFKGMKYATTCTSLRASSARTNRHCRVVIKETGFRPLNIAVQVMNIPATSQAVAILQGPEPSDSRAPFAFHFPSSHHFVSLSPIQQPAGCQASFAREKGSFSNLHDRCTSAPLNSKQSMRLQSLRPELQDESLLHYGFRPGHVRFGMGC